MQPDLALRLGCYLLALLILGAISWGGLCRLGGLLVNNLGNFYGYSARSELVGSVSSGDNCLDVVDFRETATEYHVRAKPKVVSWPL